jgi:hypothetical protein
MLATAVAGIPGPMRILQQWKHCWLVNKACGATAYMKAMS